jgi:tRNA threonylcarbamoyladenosine biosynthesis protein TsaB
MLRPVQVLALDTTVRGGSAALISGDSVVAEAPGDPARSQAEQLPGLLLHLLERAGVTLGDVDRFAVASGPGSFTGLRIGIATIQGLALVSRKRVVLVSALEALAQYGSRGLPDGAVVASWMDAHRKEVFTGLYRVTVTDGADVPRERLVELEPALVASASETLRRWTRVGARPAVFVGDGAITYAETIGGRGEVLAPPPLASIIGQMAVHRARLGLDITPDAVQPLYVRRPDAEIARDRMQSGR